MMRLIPFRTAENVITGVVITFLDINEQKQAADGAPGNERRSAGSPRIRGKHSGYDAGASSDSGQELCVVSANRSFFDTFQVSRQKIEGDYVYDLGNGQWDIPRLRELLEEVLPRNKSFEGFEVEHKFPKIGKKRMILNGRKIEQQTGGRELILLAIEDATDKQHPPEKQAERTGP